MLGPGTQADELRSWSSKLIQYMKLNFTMRVDAVGGAEREGIVNTEHGSKQEGRLMSCML